MIISSGGILAVMIGSDWDLENPATGYGQRIPASLFEVFPRVTAGIIVLGCYISAYD